MKTKETLVIDEEDILSELEEDINKLERRWFLKSGGRRHLNFLKYYLKSKRDFIKKLKQFKV